ncbi:SUF system NifU family Fe-S cluster assembly protein [bacterium]|nr:SUF system NifU family Fe-S cluster assembly protein [bacterium]
MSGDLRELYQEVILDHSKRPRNFGALPQSNRRAEGYNPLCGDRITVYMLVEDGVVAAVAFEGAGCAICTASASMMTQALVGKTEAEVEGLFRGFHALVTEETALNADTSKLGKLSVFAGVREFPIRVKCATLPWHTMRAALENQAAPVTTE